MEFLGGLSKISETFECKGVNGCEISKEANDKFDRLMGDDKLNEAISEWNDNSKLNSIEIDNKFSKLFDVGDFFKNEIDEAEYKTMQTVKSYQDPNYSEIWECNSSYVFNGDTYETDDNGKTYKRNGEILPNTEYTVNGNTYKTDEHGNKVSCDSTPKYTEDGSRNMKEQKEAGGEERQDEDDGAHIIARILGGAEGEENLIPMRRTINRGDYKRMENEISKALQDGKNVSMHTDIEYEGDSSRPSKILVEYGIDNENTVCEFDNEKGSTDLLNSLGDKICNEDYERLKQMLIEMKDDGCNTSITSVKFESDEKGNSTKVTVGILDESTGIKKYKEYSPR